MEQVSTSPVPMKMLISPAGELIKKSAAIYREIFLKFIGMGLMPVLGGLALGVIFALFFASQFLGISGAANSIILVVLGLLGLVSLVATIYLGLVSQVGLIIILRNFSLNKTAESFKQTFREAKSYAGAYLIVGLLVGILTFLWSLLLIIPGIIFGVFYSLAVYALVLENHKSMAALKRSKELITGYWWPVVGRCVLAGLIILIIRLILSIPLVAFEEGSVIASIWGMVLSVFGFLASQVYLIFSYLIFIDLVKIKSGGQASPQAV